MTTTFNYQYERAYQISSQWNTVIDDLYSGSEQRRNMWSNSRKKWVLEFTLDDTDITAVMAFFDAMKGRYEAFNWVWQATHPDTGEEMGGDGITYLVRFNDDELNFDHIVMGYKKFTVTLVQVIT
jgi:phage-related protein